MPETRADGTQFLSPVCEWKTVPDGSGVKFVKSAFFGKNEEPAVLQSFLTQAYAKDQRNLALHTHNIITPVPGSPTTVAAIPPTAVGDWASDAVKYADPTGKTYMDQISKIMI
jgi:hypothetical protein